MKGVRSRVHFDETASGALNPKKRSRPLRDAYLASGLVNVRTDGETILCATLNETKRKWNVKTFPARFSSTT